LERTHGFWELPKGITEFEGKLELGKVLLRIWMRVWEGSKGFFAGKYSRKAEFEGKV
jgi:hypothetical protein